MITKEGQRFLNEQITVLFEQLRDEQIDAHQFMRLLDMVYRDYLDFHPEEHPNFEQQ